MPWFASRKGFQVLAVRQNLASQVLQNEIRVLFREPVGIELRGAGVQAGLRVNKGLSKHLPVFANQQERFPGG